LDVEIGELIERVDGHRFWLTYLSGACQPLSRVGIHLAIFSGPFLSLVLDGRKTVESRFSRNRCAPFGDVDSGDIILLKEVAGPICGLALAKRAWFYDLTSEPLDRIKSRYETPICADDAFWESRRGASYATFIELAETAAIDPLWCDKRDRRGWVSLRSRQLAFAF